MRVSHSRMQHGSRWTRRLSALALMALLLLLTGCTPGGDQGQATAPSAPSPRVERQAIDNLLALYQEAVVAEDSDRLQALLAPATALAQTTTAPRQDSPGCLTDPTAFQAALRATFQQATVTALTIPPETVQVAPDQRSVTFLEVESTLNPQTVTQQTRVYRTTWELSRVGTGVVRLGISAVSRVGPLVEITTASLLVAGPPQPLTVRAPTAAFVLAAVEVSGPGAGAGQRLAATRGQVQATFTAVADTALQALPVRALSSIGETLVFAHHYRLHQVREGLAQRVVGTGTTRFLAVTVAPDGTVWAATDEGVSRVRRRGETVEISNFAALENVSGPVRDVAVDAVGTVWLATDTGLFRLQPGSGRAAGDTGRGAAGPRLIPVAGNNQSALPGQELPTPLVVRLEDQLGAPVVGTPLTATLLQGDAVFLSAPNAVTDAQGEARFRLRAGQSEADLVVEVATPALPEVAPVPFLAIIGEVDTPGTPRNIAVAGDLVFVAANVGSLQVIDVRDPTHPVPAHRNLPLRFPDTKKGVVALALQGQRAYVAGTGFPLRLHLAMPYKGVYIPWTQTPALF